MILIGTQAELTPREEAEVLRRLAEKGVNTDEVVILPGVLSVTLIEAPRESWE
jgi:hypothetical protein